MWIVVARKRDGVGSRFRVKRVPFGSSLSENDSRPLSAGCRGEVLAVPSGCDRTSVGQRLGRGRESFSDKVYSMWFVVPRKRLPTPLQKAAGVKSWQFRRAVIEEMPVSGQVIRGATGSGVVFGQSVFHMDCRWPKTTPDPFAEGGGSQVLAVPASCERTDAGQRPGDPRRDGVGSRFRTKCVPCGSSFPENDSRPLCRRRPGSSLGSSVGL
jgi:hypothetical protein